MFVCPVCCPFSHNLMVTRSKPINPILVVFLTFLRSARQHSGDGRSDIIIMEEWEAIESHTDAECSHTYVHAHVWAQNEGVPALFQGQSLNATAI